MTETTLQEKITSYLASSLEKFIISDFNEAIRDLKAAEVLDRHNPEILYNLGICYCRLGLYKTAIPYFEKVLALPSGFVEILSIKKILAYALINTGEFGQARANLEQVLRASPSDIPALNMTGYCFEKEGKLHEALKNYRTIIDYDPENANACNSLAYIIARTGGDLTVALDYATKALKNGPHNAAYLDTAGYVYLKMNKFKMAGEFLNKALTLQPFSKEIKIHTDELKKNRSSGTL